MEMDLFFSHSDALMLLLAPDGKILRVSEAWSRKFHPEFCPEVNQFINALPGWAFEEEPPVPLQPARGNLHFRHHAWEWSLFAAASDQFILQISAPTLLNSGPLGEAVLNSAQIAIISTDTKGLITAINQAAENALGYTAEESIGKILLETLFKGPLPTDTGSEKAAASLFQTLADSSSGLEKELAFTRKDGTTFPAQVSISPLRDEQDEIYGYLCIARDITDLAKARKKVRETQDRIQKVLEALPTGVFVLSSEGKPVYANDKAKELLGRGIIETATPDNLATVYQAYDARTGEEYSPSRMPIIQGLEGKESYADDLIIIRENDSIPIEVWGKPIRDLDGNIRYSVATFIDITDRKIAEKRLRDLLQSQQTLYAELESFTQNLKKLHATLTAQYDNTEALFLAILKTGTEVFNLELGNLARIEGNVYTLLASVSAAEATTPGTRYDLENTYCERVIEQQKTVTFKEFGKEFQDGNHPAYRAFKLESYIGAPVWVQGKIYGTLSFAAKSSRDRGFSRQEQEFIELMSQAISSAIEADQNVKILEANGQELLLFNEELQRTNKELDEFAYVVSHDLKAPLRGINNLATWLEEDLGEQLPDESRSHLTLLKGRVRRMDALIDGILEYSRAGRKKGAHTEVDVQKVMEDVLDMSNPPEGFTVTVPDNLPVIWGDRIEILQVFLNLINNAFKYHDQEHGTVEVHYKTTLQNHIFTVTDDGPGIAPEFHERIFGVFQRLEGRDEIEGAGIGLSIVRKIIESAGGTIKVKSKLGKGTRFIIRYPLKPRVTIR